VSAFAAAGAAVAQAAAPIGRLDTK